MLSISRNSVALLLLLVPAAGARAQAPTAGSVVASSVEAPEADEQGLGGVLGAGASLPAERARFEIHLGWRALQQGLAAQAAASFERVTQASPWHPGAWYLLSRARFAQNQTGAALEAAERALASYRNLPPARQAAFAPEDFLFQLGLCQSAAGRPEDAVVSLREAVSLRPDSPRLLGQLGDAYLALGRDADAAAVLQRAVEKQPDHALAWLGYGRALARLDRTAEARKALERSLELKPDSPDTWYALSSVHRAAGDFDAQEEALERFEALREPAERARLARQEIDARLRGVAERQLEGDCEGVESELRAVLEHEHVKETGFRRVRILNDLARCARLDGRDREARELYERALGENPRSFTASFELGTLLSSVGEVERGMPLLLDAAAINPFDYSVHVNLALAYGYLGRLNDAIGEIRRAAALQPENLAVRQLLVDLEWAVGNEAQARAVVARLGGVELPGEGEASQLGTEWAR